ncbi:lactococcin 972 family bacteriocin [Leifsonia sp. 22587]|uniref:lactococcin 972 family bacteriocin n=1 Tax=Leifsonia sp. 22587 TaxID=3453946 RepID=UPI003F8790B0
MKLKSVLGIGVAAAVIALVPATVASAGSTTVNAGGGLWQYGTEGTNGFGTTFSYYTHATKNHTATACDGRLPRNCKQVAAVKNQWARASLTSSYGGNAAYWNTL